MNISILGAGAVGSLWAVSLHHAGHNVHLLTRSSAESNRKIQLDDAPSITFSCNQYEQFKNCDLLLITLKAWQITDVLLPLLTQLNHDTIIVFMHNGMGVAESLQQTLHPFPVLQATTTHGALRLTTNHIKHTGQGITQIGAFNQRGKQCHFIEAVFQHALPNVEWHDDIRTLLWRKLAINGAINPLTAIYNLTNGELATTPYSLHVEQVCTEIAQLMHLEKLPLSNEDIYQAVFTVIHATANNYSSMHQDIIHHRRSEIDYITGYLLSIAQKHHIELPVNLELYSKIKSLESGESSNE